VKIGDTFIWCPDVGIDHLWILISDPDKNGGECVLVNLTESLNGRFSFVLKPGQHPFIYKDSDVNFGDAIKTKKADLENKIRLEVAKPREELDGTILQSIIQEAHKHPAFPPYLRRYLPAP
jgi:hypothetical protein